MEVCSFHVYHYEQLGPGTCEMAHCADCVYIWNVDGRPGVVGGVYMIHKHLPHSIMQDQTGLKFALSILTFHFTYYGISDQHGKFQLANDQPTFQISILTFGTMQKSCTTIPSDIF